MDTNEIIITSALTLILFSIFGYCYSSPSNNNEEDLNFID